jgi:hypothetical protein
LCLVVVGLDAARLPWKKDVTLGAPKQ